MKISIVSAAAVLALVETATAHYIFQQLSVGGTKYGVYENIRKNSNYNSPVVDLASNDLRCNEGATGAGTSTVNVKAGDSITFTLDTAVYHQGPVSAYMSKAPGKASEYDGSGGWFKIKDWGPTFSGGNANWPMSISYTFNLPTCIENGEYLLRMQQLGIHNPYPAALPQFYISCAQINVSGGGGQNPSSTVKIPGAFKETDPGYTANIYNNFNSYQIPGPSVFTCSGNSNPQPDPEPQPQPSTTLRTTTTSAGSSQPTNGGNCSPLYGQCGGKDWTGAKCCSAGNCKATNEYYSQCTN